MDATTLVEHLTDPDWVLFDCRFALGEPAWGITQYAAGHIPGARYVHLERDLSSIAARWTGRHPLPDPDALAAKLGRWGLHAGAQAVVYDEGGGAFAARLWWLLRWLGHQKAALLDGGLRAWSAAGGPLDRARPLPEAARFKVRLRRGCWAGAAELLSGLLGEVERPLLIDARTAERFRGEHEPIDPVAGHIPGAINLPFQGNLGPDGCFLDPDRLRERFAARLRDTQPQRVVHYCGSGVNACHNLLAMEVAGLSGSRLYPGSWSEWIRSVRRPVARGA